MGDVAQSTAFGRLLQEYRLRAGLTQEALAERAGLGRRSVQGLERGECQPRRETIGRLSAALVLSPPEQGHFAAAARPSPRPRTRAADSPKPPAAAGHRPERAPSQDLPTSLSSFVGREREMAEITRLLASSRLLTLTGPPGTGKTRLAVEVARATGGSFADGVFIVPLAPLDDPKLVLSAIRQRLGLREIGERTIHEALVAYLRRKSILLVLDNFEQVLAAATRVTELLEDCPALRVLATSRSALHVRGEQVYPVPPLAVPGPGDAPLVADLEQYPAIRLFVERARAAKPDFSPAGEDLRVVGEICRRLDGLPLAIELAAARGTILSPSALLARLEHRLSLLTGGARDLPARQQTLRAAISWSYNLLEPIEQVAFRRLAVFVGGWSAEGAAAVCLGDEDAVAAASLCDSPSGSEPPPILDLLESLLGKGLLQLEEQARPAGGVEPRFAMLETLREFAGERLAESGEREAIRRRHAAYFLALAEEAGPKVYGPDAEAWLDRLEREHDNFRAALGWAEEQSDATTSLRLGAALYRFWWLRDYAREGWTWLQRALANEAGRRPEDDRRSRLARARALHAAGIIAHSGLWDRVAARSLLEESLATLRELGDRRGVANSLHNLAIIVGALGDFPRAWSLYEEGLGLWRQVGERWGITAALRGMTVLAMKEGDFDRARRLGEECLTLARQDGFTFHIGQALSHLGQVALWQGDGALARARIEESLRLFRERGPRQSVATQLVLLAQVALQTGEVDQARQLLVDGLSTLRKLGVRGNPAVAWALEGFAALAIGQGQLRRAFRLAGAAAAVRDASRIPKASIDWAHLDRQLETARQALGEVGASAAWAEGRAMTLEQAITYALEEEPEVRNVGGEVKP